MEDEAEKVKQKDGDFVEHRGSFRLLSGRLWPTHYPAFCISGGLAPSDLSHRDVQLQR